MVNGQRQQQSFSRKEDAAEWLRTLERQAAGLEPIRAAVTLADGWALYQAQLAERGVSDETTRYYRPKYRALLLALGPTAVLGRITQQQISAHVEARRAAGCGNRTIRAEVALLRRMTVRAEIAPLWRMPALKITEHPRAILTPDEMARLWVEVDGAPKVALALCLLTGMRASEALRLDAGAVDRERKTISLSGRKSGDTHVVAACGTLLDLLPARGPLVDAGEYRISWALEAASKRAGVPKQTGPGIGRHCFATWAVALCGFGYDAVAEALGHARQGATWHYIHAAAVEPVRRPMALAIEAQLLAALGRLEGARVIPFVAGGSG